MLEIDKVSLYRCKHCRARMFMDDCAGHLERHEILAEPKDLRKHFVRGRKDTPCRPGDHHRPRYTPMSRRAAQNARKTEAFVVPATA